MSLRRTILSGRLRAAIRSALRSRPTTEEIARRSYAHPNGFRKIVLRDLGDGRRLRIHQWPHDQDAAPSNVHNHRWDFASFLLAGELRAEVHSLAADGREMQRYEFMPAVAGTDYALMPLSLAGTRIEARHHLLAGAGYALSANELHRVRAGRGTITAVLSGPPRSATTTVLRERGAPEQDRHLTTLTDAEVAETLERSLRTPVLTSP